MKPGDVYNICPCQASRMEGDVVFCLNCTGKETYIVNEDGKLVRERPLPQGEWWNTKKPLP